MEAEWSSPPTGGTLSGGIPLKNANESRLTRLRNIVAKDGGFTLIEVLAVMVIVGLLAAIAIPQIGKFRERAYVSGMKSDARILVNEAEGVYTDSQAYPADVAELTANVDLSHGNAVSAYTSSEDGVSFTISNTAKTSKTVSVVDNVLQD